MLKLKKALICLSALLMISFIFIYRNTERKTENKKSQLRTGFYPPPYDNLRPPPQSTKDSDGFGENGVPVKVSYDNMTSHERIEYDASRKDVYLNVFASDRISVRRYLDDNRSPECKAPKTYSNLPKTSVIIIFNNEIYSLLLRTVHSILDRSDPDLLEEIILVDDASTYDYINGRLQDYLTYLPKVRLIRMSERAGIAKARTAGAKIAKAETLMFLDSHMEVLPGWLEPLLEQLQKDPKSLAEPVHKMIYEWNFSLESRETPFVGGFGWDLEFFWKYSATKFLERPGGPYSPIPNPVLVGGMFMIGKEFFESLGYYDPNSGLYGSEHIELSLKAWLCHGSIYKVYCSWVGHAFYNRVKTYKNMNSEWMKRARDRIAYVWMGEYRKVYEEFVGPIFEDLGDISAQVEVRDKNKCHDFQWYLDNIYVDKYNPKTAIFKGQIRNPKSNSCIKDFGNASPCVKTHLNEKKENVIGSIIWFLTQEHTMRTDFYCLITKKQQGYSTMDSISCYYGNVPDQVTYNENGSKQIKTNNGCLELNAQSQKVLVKPCLAGNEYQMWEWQFLK